MRYTLIASDVHLSTVVRGPGDSMPYRREAHLADGELARVFDRAVFQAAADGAELEIVLNGDLFDLDAPPAARDSADSYAEQRTETGAARLLRQILEDHPLVTDSLSRALSGGHRVVVLPGNHDSQLAFTAVRIALAEALFNSVPAVAPRSLSFKSWFHRTPDGVHVEHGHVYDPTCVLEYLSAPADGRLEDTVGSVMSYYAPLLLSEISPYEADPIAALPEDLSTLLVSCLAGDPTCPAGQASILARFARALLLVKPSDPDGVLDPRWLLQVARETSSDLAAVKAHRALFAPKADATILARTLGKRVSTSAHQPVSSDESDSYYDYGRDTDARLRAAMARIAQLYPVRGVVMGHTHAPFAAMTPERVWIANSGSWTPTIGRKDAGPLGSFIWIVSDGTRLAGQLRHVWPSGIVT